MRGVREHSYAHVGRVGVETVPVAVRRRVPVEPVTVVRRYRSRLVQSDPVVAAAGSSIEQQNNDKVMVDSRLRPPSAQFAVIICRSCRRAKFGWNLRRYAGRILLPSPPVRNTYDAP